MVSYNSLQEYTGQRFTIMILNQTQEFLTMETSLKMALMLILGWQRPALAVPKTRVFLWVFFCAKRFAYLLWTVLYTH